MRTRIAVLILASFFALLGWETVQAQGQTDSQPKPAADCADATALQTALDARDKQLKDWPNLARYREANAAVAAPRLMSSPLMVKIDWFMGPPCRPNSRVGRTK